jgi:hypothetical protein
MDKCFFIVRYRTVLFYQGSESAWIRIIFRSWIRIRITVKNWIRIRIKLNFKGSNRAVDDANFGGLKAQNGALEGL